ncbi:MAG: host specificity factor TipJ family phage tail protein [Moraxellaceae bacterium]
MMVTIELFDHPLEAREPQVFTAESVGAWLLSHYGSRRQALIQVYRGQPSAETEITNELRALMETEGQYTVLQSPGSDGFVEDLSDFGQSMFNPSWYLTQLGLSAARDALLPDMPGMPSNVNRTQQSPNNSLGERQNKARLLERIEDIYGTVRSIPSLLQQVYRKYNDHTEIEYGYLCVGRGYYDIADVRDGDTLASEIDSMRVAFYDPFTSPNSGTPILTIGAAISEPVLAVTRSNNVDGTTLLAPDQANLVGPASYQFKTAASVGSAGDRIVQPAASPSFSAILDAGDPITVTGGAYAGSYVVASLISDNEIELTTATFASSSTVSCTIIKTGATEWTGWVTMTDAGMTEVWCNLVAPAGIFADFGSGKVTQTVDYTIEVEELDALLVATGNVIATSGTMTAKVSEQRAITVEIPLTWTGPCRVRARRTNNFGYPGGTVVDEIKWGDLYGVTPVTELHFGNVTTVQVVTKATRRALSVKERQFNCRATRRIPTYDGSTWSGTLAADGTVATGTIDGSNSFLDILAAITVDPLLGRQTLAALDIAQLWGVYQDVAAWEPLCAEFGYTLDSDNISFEETVQMIASAVFCRAYRQSGRIRFSFEQAQPDSTMLFTHRNKRPASDSITRRFSSGSEYDGVEVVYNDAVTDQSETIKLPLDESATKYKKLELPGVRNYEQAWYRANREYRRLTLQRVSIETETTADGRLLLPNARIDIVDNTRFDAMDGEVIAQSGLELTLSRDVAFGVGAHSIILMRRDGSLQSIACTAGSSANRVVLAGAPTEAVVTTPGGANGVRTIFSFGADSGREAMAYLVQEVDIRDRSYVKVSAINYDPDYYAADVEAVPARASVL